MDDAIKQIIALIEQDLYHFTEHALDRMAEYDLSEDEVCSAIMEGFITKKQRDRQGDAQWIYTILGEAHTGRALYVAGKIVANKYRVFRILSAKEDEG